MGLLWLRNQSLELKWHTIHLKNMKNRETCTCPLGGARTLILVAGIAFDGWIFFLSSKVLSTGFCHCEGLFSSISLEGDFGLASLATHLLSSYLQICAVNKSEESASPGAHNKK